MDNYFEFKRVIIFPCIIILFSCFNTTYAKEQLRTGLHNDLAMGSIDGVELFINVAIPNKRTTKASPAVLFIHGGGFVSGNKNDKNKQLKKFAAKGYVAASAMYRFSPKYKFPLQLEDIKLAIRYLKANAELLNLDPDNIIVVGSSAGSYLAVMAGVTGNSDAFSDYGLYSSYDSTVKAVIAQSPPIADFTRSKYKDSLTVKRLLNPKKDNAQANLKAMSPVTYLDSNDPPFFISHGDEDPIVPVDMSREFVAELKEIEHEFVYHEVKGGTHSLTKSAPKQAKMVFAESIKFIEKWSKVN